ncbi:hypothetical protein HMPREF1051_1277 [Neisseria sicca VK64]|uniref:Uncharacterized protein n=1 Tax=Neisseria sicca VK64 TaxID=1095748 RepID=I2NX53_NEISI|nr:hypothetical protein HMPREF1051_1277 [Neisseria sicca VK64]
MSDKSIPPTQPETQGRLKVLGNYLNSKNHVCAYRTYPTFWF